MSNTYVDSELDGSQIEQALHAITGLISPSNNGKIITVENGKFKAKSVAEFDGAVLESLSVDANGDYLPPSGVDGYNAVHVAVPTGYPEPTGTIQITQNGTVNVKDYASAEVNVPSGGGGSAVVQPLSVTQNGTYNPPSGVDGFAPVTVNVSGGGGGTIKICDFDLTAGLVDSVTGTEAILRSGATQDSSGAHLIAKRQTVDFNIAGLFDIGRTYIFSFGDINIQHSGSDHEGLVTFGSAPDSDTGFLFRGGDSYNYWSMYFGGWRGNVLDGTGLEYLNYFSNKEIGFYVSPHGQEIEIYIDGTYASWGILGNQFINKKVYFGNGRSGGGGAAYNSTLMRFQVYDGNYYQ